MEIRWLILSVLCIFTMGCASSVAIFSQPEGAEVYVDGQFVGKTPATYTDTAIVGTSHIVEVKMEGYKPTRGNFSRSSVFNSGACLGGALVLIPFLWVMDYPKSLTYKLEPEPQAALPPPRKKHKEDKSLWHISKVKLPSIDKR